MRDDIRAILQEIGIDGMLNEIHEWVGEGEAEMECKAEGFLAFILAQKIEWLRAVGQEVTE